MKQRPAPPVRDKVSSALTKELPQSRPGESEPLEVRIEKLRAQNGALKFAVAVIIGSLPDKERNRVVDQLRNLARKADEQNAEMLAFSVGEELTHTLNSALTQLVRLAAKLEDSAPAVAKQQ